jgi:putative transposase
MTETTTQTAQTLAEAKLDAVDEQLAAQLVQQARSEGISLVGPDGLLQRVTKLVVENALEGELADHLGYEHGDPAGRNGGNSRNGTRAKTVLTEVGPVELAMPRDRDSSFEPKLVRKRQRRLTGVDDLVVSLVAKGLTTGEVQAHLAQIYGAEVSRQTISTITDRVLDGLAEWQNRPLDPVYPVIFIDAIHVKIRDGQVANRPIYVALAVTVDGDRDILGLWAGDGGEGAKYWLQVLTELKNRGVDDVCIVVCDGLKGLPDAIAATWPQAVTQTCIVHLLREQLPLRLPPRLGGDRQGPAADLHGRDRAGCPGTLGGLRRYLGGPLPGDHQAVGERLGGVRPLPGLRRRDPHGDRDHQRHREPQRPVPPRGQRPRTLPQRAGRSEMPVPDDHQPGSDRAGPPAVDQPVEGRPQRLRHHLRRPRHCWQEVAASAPVTPLT